MSGRTRRSPGEKLLPPGLFGRAVLLPFETVQQGWKALQEAREARVRSEAALCPEPRSLPRITKERLVSIVADYEAGLSAYDLAEKYGHNRGTIMKHLAQAGVRSRVAVPTDDEIAEWRELHAQGLGYKTIARRVGRNHKTIRKYLSSNAPRHSVE